MNLKNPHHDQFELKIELTGPHSPNSDESPDYLIT